MNTPVNFEVCGADDYAQGYKNDRLYQDLGEDGRLYRRGWQMARLSDRTTQPTGESVAKPQERDPAAAEPEKAQEPTAITPPEAQPPQSLPAQGLDLFASPPPKPPEPWIGLQGQEIATAKPPSDDPTQMTLLDVEPSWSEHWSGMPEFKQDDLSPWASVPVHFSCRADREAFAKLVGQTITDNTRSIWYPRAGITRYVDKRFVTANQVNPMYPVYVISKGRYETRLTSDSLHRMGVEHFIVVEEQERELYAARIFSSATILVLDQAYKERYDACDDLGMSKSKGSGPARNFVWDHAKASGAKWHWLMDDNIDGFYRLYNNIKTPARTGAVFRAMEDFVGRYDNVGLAGPNYFMFASRKTVMPAFVANTRIYSCLLIRNDIPFRWRARYNEDTDLSLRVLLGGWATVLFNAFLQYKITTQTMKGGNTDEIYKDGTRDKSEMIARLHPGIARVTERFGRIHHYVDYAIFTRNPPLKYRCDFKTPSEPNDYGMELEMLTDEQRAAEAAKERLEPPLASDEEDYAK